MSASNAVRFGGNPNFTRAAGRQASKALHTAITKREVPNDDPTRKAEETLEEVAASTQNSPERKRQDHRVQTRPSSLGSASGKALVAVLSRNMGSLPTEPPAWTGRASVTTCTSYDTTQFTTPFTMLEKASRILRDKQVAQCEEILANLIAPIEGGQESVFAEGINTTLHDGEYPGGKVKFAQKILGQLDYLLDSSPTSSSSYATKLDTSRSLLAIYASILGQKPSDVQDDLSRICAKQRSQYELLLDLLNNIQENQFIRRCNKLGLEALSTPDFIKSLISKTDIDLADRDTGTFLTRIIAKLTYLLEIDKHLDKLPLELYTNPKNNEFLCEASARLNSTLALKTPTLEESLTAIDRLSYKRGIMDIIEKLEALKGSINPSNITSDLELASLFTQITDHLTSRADSPPQIANA